MQIQNELQQFFKHHTNDKLRIWIIHETQKLNKYFKVKENQALIHRLNVIYQIITCNCETITAEKQNAAWQQGLMNITQHQSYAKIEMWDLSEHLMNNTKHSIDFTNPKILGTARNRTKLLILETLKIRKMKPHIQ